MALNAHLRPYSYMYCTLSQDRALQQVLHDIISMCIIMHNMIIEDEYDTHGSIVDLNVMSVPEVDMIVDKTEQFQWFFACHKRIKDTEAHYTLRNALIKHLWGKYNNNVSCS